MVAVRTMAEIMLSFSSMSNKKLQKLCYYAYSWYLTIYGVQLSPFAFEAWVHGPVSRELYNSYKSYGWDDIPKYQGFVLAGSDVIEFAEKIWGLYGGYTADELEEMTHQEAPWINARKGYQYYESSSELLRDDDIVAYFSQKKELLDRLR